MTNTFLGPRVLLRTRDTQAEARRFGYHRCGSGHYCDQVVAVAESKENAYPSCTKLM